MTKPAANPDRYGRENAIPGVRTLTSGKWNQSASENEGPGNMEPASMASPDGYPRHAWAYGVEGISLIHTADAGILPVANIQSGPPDSMYTMLRTFVMQDQFQDKTDLNQTFSLLDRLRSLRSFRPW